MDNAIKYTHLASVIIFMLIYIIKTGMLLMNNKGGLKSFTKMVKVPEMIVSTLFLGTGVYMLTQIPSINMFMIIKIVAVLLSIPLAVIGFKKGNKALASVSLLLIIGAYGLAEISHKKMVTGADNTNIGTDGKAIYVANCIQCHGEDGKLGVIGAADLSATKLDKEMTFSVIAEGRGTQMVGFHSILNDDQIHAVMDYINKFKK